MYPAKGCAEVSLAFSQRGNGVALPPDSVSGIVKVFW